MTTDGSQSNSHAARYASRAGEKLAAALDRFEISAKGLTCADLGSHVGGFVDCLLQSGAAKVYSVDTSYGTLAWTLRKDERVVVLERTNAMHVTLPEPVDLVTIDVGWTPQARILPAADRILKAGGHVVTLVKPHYEAPKEHLTKGVLADERTAEVLENVKEDLSQSIWRIVGEMESPLRGHGGNREYLLHLRRA